MALRSAELQARRMRIAVVAMIVQQPRRACRETVTDGENGRYRTVPQAQTIPVSGERHNPILYAKRNFEAIRFYRVLCLFASIAPIAPSNAAANR